VRREAVHKIRKGKHGAGGTGDLPPVGGSFPSSHPRLPGFLALLRFNLRSLLKPWSLFLLAVSALSSYYAVYVSFHPYSAGGVPSSWADAIRGLASLKRALGLHPLLIMDSYHILPWVIGGFTAFMFAGGTALVYVGACNLVAEDSGCLPRSLLHSRPVSRTGFLLAGFVVRFAAFAAHGFVVPFLIAYAQNVADIGATAQSVITNYMTMDQWYATAWNGLFWQYLAIFVAYLFALASLALLLSAATGRGLIGILAGVLLSYVTGYAAWQITGDYVTSGTTLGGVPSLPAFMVLIPAFYLVAAIYSTPGFAWRLQAPLFGFPTGMGFLTLYGAALVALSVLAYRRRGGAE